MASETASAVIAVRARCASDAVDVLHQRCAEEVQYALAGPLMILRRARAGRQAQHAPVPETLVSPAAACSTALDEVRVHLQVALVG
jgi:hypothetical protein